MRRSGLVYSNLVEEEGYSNDGMGDLTRVCVCRGGDVGVGVDGLWFEPEFRVWCVICWLRYCTKGIWNFW